MTRGRENEEWEKLQEKTRAAAAPRKPKKGAVSSPEKVDDMAMMMMILPVCYEDLSSRNRKF